MRPGGVGHRDPRRRAATPVRSVRAAGLQFFAWPPPRTARARTLGISCPLFRGLAAARAALGDTVPASYIAPVTVIHFEMTAAVAQRTTGAPQLIANLEAPGFFSTSRTRVRGHRVGRETAGGAPPLAARVGQRRLEAREASWALWRRRGFDRQLRGASSRNGHAAPVARPAVDFGFADSTAGPREPPARENPCSTQQARRVALRRKRCFYLPKTWDATIPAPLSWAKLKGAARTTRRVAVAWVSCRRRRPCAWIERSVAVCRSPRRTVRRRTGPGKGSQPIEAAFPPPTSVCSMPLPKAVVLRPRSPPPRSEEGATSHTLHRRPRAWPAPSAAANGLVVEREDRRSCRPMAWPCCGFPLP